MGPAAIALATAVILALRVFSNSQRGRGRADDDVEIAAPRGQGVDDLDDAGRVPEAVAGDIEDDGGHHEADCQLPVASFQFKGAQLFIPGLGDALNCQLDTGN